MSILNFFRPKVECVYDMYDITYWFISLLTWLYILIFLVFLFATMRAGSRTVVRI